MSRGEMLYEGKAKQVFAASQPGQVIMLYKDDATAFDGLKKGVIAHKGVLNNRISTLLFDMLEQRGIETHLLKTLDERSVLIKRLDMLPVEVVVRNVVAGSLVQKLGQPEGTKLSSPIIEFYYKNDALHDPMINEYHIQAMGWASLEQLRTMQELALRINKVLQEFFDRIDLILVDFKLEFGQWEGRVVLGDEISPDTCRLWDKNTGDKLDKDRFRRDLGHIEEAYQEVTRRIETALTGGGSLEG